MAAKKTQITWKVSRGTMATKEGDTKMFGITATLCVDGVEVLDLNDISVIDGKKGMYIGLPRRSYQKNGETKHVRFVYPKGEHMDALTEAVLGYFDEQ
jgi:DNA-binding cell septation regulator SpoVG